MDNVNFIFISLILSNSFLNFCNGKEVCGDKEKCISKCCPGKAYFNASKVCVQNDEFKKDFSTVDVYNNNLARIGSVKDIFTVIDGKPLPLIPNDSLIKKYLLENGQLYIEIMIPNGDHIKKTVKSFCIDYIQNNNELVPCFGELDEDHQDNTGNYKNKNKYIKLAGLLISSVFFLLTLTVYWILEELRNLQGKFLMSYVFSLFSAYILMAIMQIITIIIPYTPSDDYCYGFTTTIYFFILSSCCWMNVMSFDIWSAFRRTREIRRVNSKKKYTKFMKYSTYAWGIPLIMAITLISIDKTDLTEKPWIIKPDIIFNGCFLSDTPKLVYLIVPMFILILINWAFFLMTAFNYYQAKRSTVVVKTSTSNRHESNSESFFMYFKLSLVMGVSWIFEVLSNLLPGLWLWYISDFYNMLIGVALFVIFVCKKRTFNKLSKRFRKHHSSSEDAPPETIAMSTSNY